MKYATTHVFLLAAFFVVGHHTKVQAQGNLHSPGEGGVFTQARLSQIKGVDAENSDLGNNPWMMDLYNDMRTKFGRLGEEVNLSLEDIDGTIYLNEDFTLGVLYEDGVAFKHIYMRYDAYNDEVELKETLEEDVVRSMVKHPKYSCSINQEKFIYTDYIDEEGKTKNGYLLPLVYGGDHVLYQRQIKIFKEGKPAKTSLDNSFPHRFLDKTEYFVSPHGNTPQYMRTKKSEVLAFFKENQQNTIKNYMKGKRIDFDDSTDLKNLFAYANTLQWK